MQTILVVSARFAECAVAMGRGAQLSKSDATALITEVQDFIARYGRRPARATPLGRRAYNLARQYAETPESQQMREVLSTARHSWRSTIEQIQHIHQDAELPEEQEPSQRKRFKANQDYQTRLAVSVGASRSVSVGASGSCAGYSIWKRPAEGTGDPTALSVSAGTAASSTSAPPTLFLGRQGPGSRKASEGGTDLSSMQWPARVGVVQALPQEAVDFLYKALSDFSHFMDDKPLSNPWFVCWGTLLGAHRGRGLIPYDVDVDVAIQVESNVEFTQVWFPKIAAHFASLKYRVHPVPCAPAASAGGRPLLRGCKLVPQKAQCLESGLFRELMHRRQEKAVAAGECLSRVECAKAVSESLKQADGARKHKWASEAIGRVVLDIEVCTIAKGRLWLQDVHFPVPGPILCTVPLQFGPLTVPAPRDMQGALSVFFPGGFSNRMYQNANGRLYPVPASVPDRVLPSEGVCS